MTGFCNSVEGWRIFELGREGEADGGRDLNARATMTSEARPSASDPSDKSGGSRFENLKSSILEFTAPVLMAVLKF